MKTVLYFHVKLKTSAQKKLDGMREIAKKLAWNIQGIEIFPDAPTLQGLVSFWNPVGIIVEASARNVGERFPDHIPNVPVVFLDAPPGMLRRSSFSVTHDSRQTGEDAAKVLLNANFKNFAYIPFPTPYVWSDIRRDGFLAALKLNGYGCSVMDNAAEGENILAFQRRLGRFIASLPRPTAVFAANDTAGEIVLAEIARQGFRTTEDFAVLSVDNYAPICERLSLSSIEPDFHRAGRLSMLLLAAAVRDGRSFHGDRARFYGSLRVVNRGTTRTPVSPVDRDVPEALDLIYREACNGLKAEDVLSGFRCSRATAASKFKRVTGRTILQEIHRVRLERVQSMLLDSRQQITAISDFCGFRCPNSLKKLFKREFGLSMRAWRKKNTALAR